MLLFGKGKTNAMYDEKDDYAEMSQTGRYFIGGLLEHARAITAINLSHSKLIQATCTRF